MSLPCAAAPRTIVQQGRSRLFYPHPSLLVVRLGRGSRPTPRFQVSSALLLTALAPASPANRYLLTPLLHSSRLQQPLMPYNGHINSSASLLTIFWVNGDSVLSIEGAAMPIQVLALRGQPGLWTCRYHWLAGKFGCAVCVGQCGTVRVLAYLDLLGSQDILRATIGQLVEPQ